LLKACKTLLIVNRAVMIFTALLIILFLFGCQKREDSHVRIGGSIASSPEEYSREFKDSLTPYKQFKTIEEAAEYAGFIFRYPKSGKAGKIFGVYVSPRRNVVLVLFDDYPPYGMYLSVIKKPKKPDYEARVRKTEEEIKEGKVLVFSPPQLVTVAGYQALGEEPSLQGPNKDFPVAARVTWWDRGIEYTLFGKADGKNPSTTLGELVAIAESCYY